jgi:hypothetical protein
VPEALLAAEPHLDDIPLDENVTMIGERESDHLDVMKGTLSLHMRTLIGKTKFAQKKIKVSLRS